MQYVLACIEADQEAGFGAWEGFVPRPEELYSGAGRIGEKEKHITYLNSALSSANPAASASTAAGVPTLRSANMARYRSNSGSAVSSSVARSAAMCSGDASSGAALPASSPDVGGAGSMDVYDLCVRSAQRQVAG